MRVQKATGSKTASPMGRWVMGQMGQFWRHQLVKFDFTADLTGSGNRSEEVIK